MSACESRWWAGLGCDHLYADCPNRTRHKGALERAGWWESGSSYTGVLIGTVDPHGEFICGMCLHRHNRTKHKAGA